MEVVANLTGYAVTLLVALAGLFKLREEIRRKRSSELSIKMSERNLDAIYQVTSISEEIRAILWKMFRTIDMSKPLDPSGEALLEESSKLRARMLAWCVFIPETLSRNLDGVFRGIDDYTDAFASKQDCTEINNKLKTAILSWQRTATEWKNAKWNAIEEVIQGS